MTSSAIISFWITRMSMTEIVPIPTTMMDSNRGLAFWRSNTPIREYPRGLSSGGSSGEKRNTIPRTINCTIIGIYFDINLSVTVVILVMSATFKSFFFSDFSLLSRYDPAPNNHFIENNIIT